MALFASDGPLATVIAEQLGTEPELELVWQATVQPPHPSWVDPLPRMPLLVRHTRYVIPDGREVISVHLAWVDVRWLEPESAAELLAGHLTLGDIFDGKWTAKGEFEFGTHDDGTEVSAALAAAFQEMAGPAHGFRWRRYLATIREVPAAVVVEALIEEARDAPGRSTADG